MSILVADHIYNTIQKVTMFQQSPNKIIMDGIEHNVLRGKCARWDVLCRVGLNLFNHNNKN